MCTDAVHRCDPTSGRRPAAVKLGQGVKSLQLFGRGCELNARPSFGRFTYMYSLEWVNTVDSTPKCSCTMGLNAVY
jgi:hypothetical protein